MNTGPNQPQNQQPLPPPPKPEYRFRWEIFIGIPLTAAAFFYVIANIEPSFHFSDILELLHVTDKTRYTRLACIGVLCVAFLLIAKLFRKK